jgi:large subunit ribosomal protein L6
MSRIGKLPITIPEKVNVKVDGNNITVKGPKGELTWDVVSEMEVSLKEGSLIVQRSSDTKQVKALHGMTRNIILNMVTGVSSGYQKVLVITGVGYKAQVQGKKILLSLGYSHPVEFIIPDGITAEVDSRQGIDKQLLGQVAANIRTLRLPDSYKGKGVRYSGEMIKLKAGKAGK